MSLVVRWRVDVISIRSSLAPFIAANTPPEDRKASAEAALYHDEAVVLVRLDDRSQAEELRMLAAADARRRFGPRKTQLGGLPDGGNRGSG